MDAVVAGFFAAAGLDAGVLLGSAAAIVGNPMLRDHVIKRTPLARHAQPEEIAGAAVYLLSDVSSFTTGSVVVADGGLTSA